MHYNTKIPAIKNEEILPFAATWRKLEDILLSQTSQRQILYDLAYTWTLKFKNKTKNLIEKEIRFVIMRGERGGWDEAKW